MMSEAVKREPRLLRLVLVGQQRRLEYLDMVIGFNPAQLVAVGSEGCFNGANGIKSTAVTAKIYGGVQPTPTPTPTHPGTHDADADHPAPTTPAPTTPDADDPAPPSKGCTAALVVSNTWPGGYQAAVTVKNGSAMISSWKTAFTLPSGGSVAERLVRHLLPVRLHRDGVQRRLERAARRRRVAPPTASWAAAPRRAPRPR